MSAETCKIEECVATATRRLQPDPELRMDIRQELRAHLQDKVEAATAGGASDEQALESALKSFGDPEEVGKQVWQANRKRMRLRAVLKWTARVTLAPAVVLTLVLLLLSLGEVLGGIKIMNMMGETLPSDLSMVTDTLQVNWLVRRAMQERFRPGITEEDRRVFYGKSGDIRESRLESARSLTERFLDDPVIYGHYATILLATVDAERSASESEGAMRMALEDVLAALERGEEIEPQNAYYNYMKAAVLMDYGAEIALDEESTYEILRWGKVRKETAHKLIVRDRRLVEQAIAEFRNGNRKSFYDSHSFDFALLRQGMLREPETFVEEISRIARMAGILMPDLAMSRQMMRGVVAYSKLLAEEGDRGESTAILREVRVPPLILGASSRILIELLLAAGTLQESLAEAALVHEQLGDGDSAEEARVEARQERALFEGLRGRRSDALSEREFKEDAGLILGLTLPAIRWRGDQAMFRSWRMLERVLFERAVLTALLFTILPLALIYLLARTFVTMVRCRRLDDGPKLFFVGWQRLVKIIGLSVFVPPGLYLLYTRLAPFGGAQYGINYCPDRFVLELVVMGLAVLGLSLVTCYRAVRARCKEAGMVVPADRTFTPGWVWRIVGALSFILLISYALKWQDRKARVLGWKMPDAGFLLAVALFIAAGAWLLATGWRFFSKLPEGLRHFQRTLIRSFTPILALVMLTFGLSSHIYLRLAERHYVRLVQRPGQRVFTDELEMSAFNDYRAHLTKLHQAIMSPTGAAKTP